MAWPPARAPLHRKYFINLHHNPHLHYISRETGVIHLDTQHNGRQAPLETDSETEIKTETDGYDDTDLMMIMSLGKKMVEGPVTARFFFSFFFQSS